MAYLEPKSKKGSSWLPTQVVYGIDCSDVDPAKWTEFGRVAEERAQEQSASSKQGTKGGGGSPPTRE